MSGARILVVTWDGAGNFPPERSVVRALIERGNSVHVMAHDSLRAAVASDDASFVALHSAPQYDSTEPIPPDKELAFTLQNVWLARGYATDVASAIDALRPHLILVDAAVVYGVVAAIQSRLPTVAMWSTMYSLVCGGPFRELLDSHLSGINAFAKEVGVGPFPSIRTLLESAALVLVFGYREFDPVGDLASHVLHVGPLRRSTECLSPWERRYPHLPLVLVGLSTGYQAQTTLLSKLSEALSTLDVEAIVTTGPAIPQDSVAAGRNTTVVDFISHDTVLPKTDLLITHAGHGTVMAGLSYGVPMLCVPMGRDQPFVASRVADLGVGRLLSPKVSVREIRGAIRAAIGDTAMKNESAALASSLKGHPGLEQAVDALVELL